MADIPQPSRADQPHLRLTGTFESPEELIDHDDGAGESEDPAGTAFRLIDSMSRRIDVLARQLHLDGGDDRPRAA